MCATAREPAGQSAVQAPGTTARTGSLLHLRLLPVPVQLGAVDAGQGRLQLVVVALQVGVRARAALVELGEAQLAARDAGEQPGRLDALRGDRRLRLGASPPAGETAPSRGELPERPVHDSEEVHQPPPSAGAPRPPERVEGVITESVIFVRLSTRMMSTQSLLPAQGA